MLRADSIRGGRRSQGLSVVTCIAVLHPWPRRNTAFLSVPSRQFVHVIDGPCNAARMGRTSGCDVRDVPHCGCPNPTTRCETLLRSPSPNTMTSRTRTRVTFGEFGGLARHLLICIVDSTRQTSTRVFVHAKKPDVVLFVCSDKDCTPDAKRWKTVNCPRECKVSRTS